MQIELGRLLMEFTDENEAFSSEEVCVIMGVFDQIMAASHHLRELAQKFDPNLPEPRNFVSTADQYRQLRLRAGMQGEQHGRK